MTEEKNGRNIFHAVNKEKYSSINRIAIAERASLEEVDRPSPYSAKPLSCNSTSVWLKVVRLLPCLYQVICGRGRPLKLQCTPWLRWFSKSSTGGPDRLTVSGPEEQESGEIKKKKRLKSSWTIMWWPSPDACGKPYHPGDVAAVDICFSPVRSHQRGVGDNAEMGFKKPINATGLLMAMPRWWSLTRPKQPSSAATLPGRYGSAYACRASVKVFPPFLSLHV